MINRAILTLIFVFLAGCNTSPVIVPDNTKDSPVMMKLKHQILNDTQITNNWGWILWYLPVLLLVLAWVWKEFINKPLHLDDKEDREKTQPAPQDDQNTVP